MHSFTFASEEGCIAVVENLPERYAMELVRSDMIGLVEALRIAWENCNDWAGDFLSSIATTVDVEFI